MNRGRAFVFGDNVDTDVLAPGKYMNQGIEVIAAHCLENLSPTFVSSVKAGDLVVGGRNFGIGSSREQAPQALKYLGVSVVIAKSFAGIFYRNAINLGLPVLTCEDTDQIEDGDELAVDIRAGIVRNETKNLVLKAEPLPEFLMEMIEGGGLIPSLERRLAKGTAAGG